MKNELLKLSIRYINKEIDYETLLESWNNYLVTSEATSETKVKCVLSSIYYAGNLWMCYGSKEYVDYLYQLLSQDFLNTDELMQLNNLLENSHCNYKEYVTKIIESNISSLTM